MKQSLSCSLHEFSPGWWDSSLIQKYNVNTKEKFGIIDPINCARTTVTYKPNEDPREYGRTHETKTNPVQSNTRNRGMAIALNMFLSHYFKREVKCVSEITNETDFAVWDTMSYGPFQDALKKLPMRIVSEYIPSGTYSGEVINGIRHEDLMNSSFNSNSVDLVLTTEIFEHIPDPYKAFAEIHRVLKLGGAHVFTVPFTNQKEDIVFSRLEKNGQITHVHPKAPQYHGDALRKEGIIVFSVFGYEMLSKLCAMGYDIIGTKITKLEYGVVGDLIVFIAMKKTSTQH